MKGGVAFFRGTGGAAARRYLEQDQALNAAGYYTENNHLLATRTAYGTDGTIQDIQLLTSEEYQGWVEWKNPRTGETRGNVKERINPKTGRRETSVLMLDKTINTSKDLSLAAVLDPAVSAALDRAMADAADAIGAYLVANLHTRIMEQCVRSWVRPEQLEIATVTHQTSREGDPFRHIHMQVLNRVYAQGKWRALDTAEFTKHNAALNALGTAVIHGHPELRAALTAAGFSFNAATGQITELAPYTDSFSKRTLAIAARKQELLTAWQEKFPGQTPGIKTLNKIDHQGWADTRSEKSTETAANPERWKQALYAAGYRPAARETSQQVTAGTEVYSARDITEQQPEAIGELAAQSVAAVAEHHSGFSRATLQATISTQLVQMNMLGTKEELETLTKAILGEAISLCTAINPDIDPALAPGHLPTMTCQQVLASEARLFENLAVLETRATTAQLTYSPATRPLKLPAHTDVPLEALNRLFASYRFTDPEGNRITAPTDVKHREALSAMAGTRQLVTVTGPAGAGKTTLLKAAGAAVSMRGGRQFIVAPSAQAAEVAGKETGAKTGTAHGLLKAFGYTWTTDPVTGATSWKEPARDHAVPHGWVLRPGDQLVVDEAGMLSQDVAIRLQEIALKTGAQLVLTGDYAQLAAVGRGGVLQKAAEISSASIDLESVWRFKTAEGVQDTDYAQLSLKLRERKDSEEVFDALVARGLVNLHADEEAVRDTLARQWLSAHVQGRNIVIAASTNEDVTAVNMKVALQRTDRPFTAALAEQRFARGMEGQAITVGDIVRARKNNSQLGVLNGKSYVMRDVTDGFMRVQSTGADGSIHVLPKKYVAEHVQLGYALTVHAAQGITVDAAHLLVTGATDGAGVYVGLSRGRFENHAHFVADSLEEAREQFIAAVSRNRADAGLSAAREELAQLVKGTNLEHPVEKSYKAQAKGKELKPGDVFFDRGKRWWVLENKPGAEDGSRLVRVLPARTGAPARLTQVFRVGADEPVAMSSKQFIPHLPGVEQQKQAALQEMKVQQQYLEAVDVAEAWVQNAQEHPNVLLAYGRAQVNVELLERRLGRVESELGQVRGEYERAVALRQDGIDVAARRLERAQEERRGEGLLKRAFVPAYEVTKAQQNLARAQGVPVPGDRDVRLLENRVTGLRADLSMWLGKVKAAEGVLGAVPAGEGSGVSVNVDGQGKTSHPDFGQVRAEAQEKLEAAQESVQVLGSTAGVVAGWVGVTDSVVAGRSSQQVRLLESPVEREQRVARATRRRDEQYQQSARQVSWGVGVSEGPEMSL